MTADHSPRTASMTDFRRFFGQLLRDSREACREEPGGAWAGLPPVVHAGNRRLQFHNAIVSEAFLRSFFRNPSIAGRSVTSTNGYRLVLRYLAPNRCGMANCSTFCAR